MSPTSPVQSPKSKAPISAGCLVTRRGEHGIEALLVHPRGATFTKPLFGIPKGLVESDETAEVTALRETLEETGLRVRLQTSLGSVRQKSGKIVFAFWATVEPESESGIDAQGRCLAHDSENNVCRFYSIEKAAELMILAQREFLTRLPDAATMG
jgi:predicted NUDIX family NTP pyrophosphohydrolase